MLILDHAPKMTPQEASAFYERSAREGMVHSSIMCGQHYDVSPHFDEAWASPSVSWFSGGEETYRFSTKRALTIKTAGALTIAQGERYAYDAHPDMRFRSNMIIFPQWFVQSTSSDEFSAGKDNTALGTRLFHPSPVFLQQMNAMTANCFDEWRDEETCTEYLALFYQQLLNGQRKNSAEPIDTAKPATRKELVRRVEVAVQMILECYTDRTLSTADIACSACLSRFHLIRVFKSYMGETPMQYLTRVRLENAARLLEKRERSVDQIARSVGYANRTSFVRAFTRRFGAPPSSFRHH